MLINFKLIIIVLFIGLTSCNNKSNSQNKTMKKFEWRPTANAPKNYPAEIISGNFYLEDSTSIYIPSGHALISGWGNTGARHIVGEDFKAIPNKFDIKWVSYLEQKFYGGTFKLPKDKILNIFEEGFIGLSGEKETFTNIVLGLAPGGVIVIWLNGNKSVEIGRFNAKEIEVTKEEFIPNAVLSVKEFVQESREDFIKEDIKGALDPDNIPFGLWNNYSTNTYNYKTIFSLKSKGSFSDIYLHYINGENFFTVANNPELKEYKLSALPLRTAIYWEDENKNVYGSKLDFNEDEVKKAFEAINNTSENKKIDLVFEVDKYNGNIEILLKSDTDSYKLEKTKIKIFETTK